MSESGMLVSAEALSRFSEATKFYENRKSELIGTEGQIDQIAPGSARNLRGWLLQDVWHGEKAKVALAHNSPQLSSFKIDQFGLWDRVSFPFQIRLRPSPRPLSFPPSSQPLLPWTSAPLVNPTSITLRQAFAVPGAPPLVKVQVTGGSGSLEPLERNSLYNPPPFNHGFWLISINYSIPLELDVIVSGNILADSRVLSVTKMTDIDSNRRIIATDVLDLDRPLSRGSKVILTHFSDVGWGITSAFGKQFVEVTSAQ